jgi:hypothetical protein
MATATDSVPDKPPRVRADSFFGWDQLILLLTPFPVLAVANVAYILGWDHNAVDGIRAIYLTPLVFASLGSFFMLPVVLVIALLVLIGRNIYFRRIRRLTVYAVVLVGIPLCTSYIDDDYIRFLLQERKFAIQSADAMPPHSAYCFLFDEVEDNFYLGGANFSPYEKLILYVSGDLEAKDNPMVKTFRPDSRCPPPSSIRHIRRLRGRYYLADTFGAD